jgi:hypothetical protein
MQVMTMIIHCVQEMKSERIIITQDIVNNA